MSVALTSRMLLTEEQMFGLVELQMSMIVWHVVRWMSGYE